MEVHRRRSLSLTMSLVAMLVQEAYTAPVNDLLENALPLTGLNVNTSGSNVAATKEPNEPNHAGFAGGRSVWWKWTNTAAPHTVMEVNTIGSSFHTLLGVYIRAEGQSGGLMENLITEGSHSNRLTFVASATNRPYYLAVDGLNAISGNIVLNMLPPPPPANDAFANAILVSGSRTPPRGTTPTRPVSRANPCMGRTLMGGRFGGAGRPRRTGWC